MTKLATPDFAVDAIWPTAYRQRHMENGQAGRELWFTTNDDRYAMDFSECGYHSDWYQYDSRQDAWYFGQWVNPVKLLVLAYIEGDIHLTRCADAQDYRAEIARLDHWNQEHGHALRPCGIDDHDGRHWAKLEGQR